MHRHRADNDVTAVSACAALCSLP